MNDSPRTVYPQTLVLIVGIIVFCLSCLALLGAGYLYYLSQKTSHTAASTDKANIVLAVHELVDVPTGETPQVVTITDIAALKNQLFFARARVGDVLIVYKEHHVAILYDPKEHKIVNMSKISVIIPRPAVLQ